MRAEQPDLAILIDFPDVNLRLAARALSRSACRLFIRQPAALGLEEVPHPQRAALRGPDAGDFSLRRGVLSGPRGGRRLCRPSAGRSDPPAITRDDFARENGLDPSKHWVGLLPGSRSKEMRRQLAGNARSRPSCWARVRIPAPAGAHLKPGAAIARSCRATLPRLAPQSLVHDARAALHHARASIVASGRPPLKRR